MDLSTAIPGDLFIDNYGDEWEFIGITKRFPEYACYIMQGSGLILWCDKEGNGGHCPGGHGTSYKIMRKL